MAIIYFIFFYVIRHARISVYSFLYLAIFIYDSYAHRYLVNFEINAQPCVEVYVLQ